MPDAAAIAAYLEERVPSNLKMDFDNVGLLCGFPDREVRRVLVALDATLEVIDEAAEKDVQLIVTHHPVIFHPMKTLRTDDPDGRRLIAMIKHGLSAICLHTNLDVVRGGVNDALAAKLTASVTEELRIGRIAELPDAESFSAFAGRVKSALSVSGLRGYDAGKAVRRIALCGGSGGDILCEAAAMGCDTVLTGEIRYNQWLDGRELGLNLMEADHFCTENVVVPVLSALLREGFPELEIFESARHKQTSQGL